jgi:putative endonuclease
MNQAHLSGGYYVYLACCANGTLYVGCTTNVERRIAAHNTGQGGRYTRSNRPVSLVAAWPFSSKAEALRTERVLKRLPPERKLAMAEQLHLLKEQALES